jgi:hypothetical protein
LTPSDVLDLAAVAGIGVRLRPDGTPALDCPAGVRPNAALMAALKEHRAGIVDLLNDSPVTCDGCRALVREVADDLWWCSVKACPQRKAARRQSR